MSTSKHTGKGSSALLVLSLGALGVVFGDIGTSPLYALNEILFGRAHMSLTPETVIGVLSVVVWTLTIIISVKYLVFVMRADSGGEGGVFTLYSLLYKMTHRGIAAITLFLILAAGLLLGEGIITPAISVLSAVEGMKIVTASVNPFIVPMTILILTGLFVIQSKGTAKIGKLFGPIITVWFVTIGFLGLSQIIRVPGILAAWNPLYAVRFLVSHNIGTLFIVLGSVMLVVTGGEAMYADMGHFGRTPIRLAWFFLAYPALLLNYLGQGAYVMSGSPVLHENIFYSMVPHSFLIPVVILATMATVIASQALISGAFSLISQAVTLGLMPFIKIIHTHHEHEGQIYIPLVNMFLFVGSITLVVWFQTSARLASAYGLSVSGVMLMTSLAMFAVSRYYWKWSKIQVVFVFGTLAFIDLIFFLANTLKFFEGGFIPMGIGVVILLLMTLWRWGRQHISDAYERMTEPVPVQFLANMQAKSTSFINQSMVVMTPTTITSLDDRIPLLEQIILDRSRKLSRHIVFLTVVIQKEPHLHDKRFDVHLLYSGNDTSISSVQVNFGFMEDPNVEKVLEELAREHLLHISENHREWVIEALAERVHLHRGVYGIYSTVRFHLFRFMLRNAQTADQYYRLGNETKLSIEVVPVYFR